VRELVDFLKENGIASSTWNARTEVRIKFAGAAGASAADLAQAQQLAASAPAASQAQGALPRSSPLRRTPRSYTRGHVGPSWQLLRLALARAPTFVKVGDQVEIARYSASRGH